MCTLFPYTWDGSVQHWAVLPTDFIYAWVLNGGSFSLLLLMLANIAQIHVDQVGQEVQKKKRSYLCSIYQQRCRASIMNEDFYVRFMTFCRGKRWGQLEMEVCFWAADETFAVYVSISNNPGGFGAGFTERLKVELAVCQWTCWDITRKCLHSWRSSGWLSAQEFQPSHQIRRPRTLTCSSTHTFHLHFLCHAP